LPKRTAEQEPTLKAVKELLPNVAAIAPNLGALFQQGEIDWEIKMQ
jgi:hypothetical protein